MAAIGGVIALACWIYLSVRLWNAGLSGIVIFAWLFVFGAWLFHRHEEQEKRAREQRVIAEQDRLLREQRGRDTHRRYLLTRLAADMRAVSEAATTSAPSASTPTPTPGAPAEPPPPSAA